MVRGMKEFTERSRKSRFLLRVKFGAEANSGEDPQVREIGCVEHGPMFLRKKRKSGNGKGGAYWTL